MKKILMLLIFILFASIIHAKVMKLQSHYDNYVMPVSIYYYDDLVTESKTDTEKYYEIAFQISIEKELVEFFDWKFGFAYTHRSWWDFYDRRPTLDSGYFRDSNYNPQLFIRTPVFGNFRADAGYWHESNGQLEEWTRSWDRLYTDIYYTIPSVDFHLQLWEVFFTSYNHEGETDEIVNLVGPGELNFTLKLGELVGPFFKDVWVETKLNIPSPTVSSGYQQVSLTVPSLFFEGPYYYYQIRQGYYDSLLDYKESMYRYSVGLKFNR